MPGKVRVYVERGSKRVFASAADWPGWSRGGKDEASALATLSAYAQRYAPVPRLAGLTFAEREPAFEVVERLSGGASADFGVPGTPARDEARAPTPAQGKRMRSLLEASWTYLDMARAKAPAALRKGPRGGGRDREPIYDHVVGAEVEYAKRLGLRLKQPPGGDAAAVRAFRDAILEGMGDSSREKKWPLAYFVRRAAWHVLDHAWEMEDRIP